MKYLENLETKWSYENIRDVQVSKVKGSAAHRSLTSLRYIEPLSSQRSQKNPIEKLKSASSPKGGGVGACLRDFK